MVMMETYNILSQQRFAGITDTFLERIDSFYAFILCTQTLLRVVVMTFILSIANHGRRRSD
jgi:hypothetical protein